MAAEQRRRVRDRAGRGGPAQRPRPRSPGRGLVRVLPARADRGRTTGWIAGLAGAPAAVPVRRAGRGRSATAAGTRGRTGGLVSSRAGDRERAGPAPGRLSRGGAGPPDPAAGQRGPDLRRHRPGPSAAPRAAAGRGVRVHRGALRRADLAGGGGGRGRADARAPDHRGPPQDRAKRAAVDHRAADGRGPAAAAPDRPHHRGRGRPDRLPAAQLLHQAVPARPRGDAGGLADAEPFISGRCRRRLRRSGAERAGRRRPAAASRVRPRPSAAR
jgi:hypothetical protein